MPDGICDVAVMGAVGVVSVVETYVLVLMAEVMVRGTTTVVVMVEVE